VETPRFDTIWFKVLKERERSVQPDHLYYFTKNTFTEMIEKSGFCRLRFDYVGRTLTFDRLLTNVSIVIDKKWFSRFSVRLSDLLTLNRIRFHINLHDMMRGYFIKR
jgi:hypothetical protein